MKDEISQMTEHQSNLEDKFKDAISKKQHLKSSFKDDMKLQETEEEIGNAGRELKNSTRWLDHMVQQRPLTNDTIDKIQKDRSVSIVDALYRCFCMEHIGRLVRMSVSGYRGRPFEPRHKYVVPLSKTLYPHCFGRLSCEMSTRWGQPRVGCSML